MIYEICIYSEEECEEEYDPIPTLQQLDVRLVDF